MSYSKETMNRIWGLRILDVARELNISYSEKGAYRKCLCFMHEDHHPSMWLKPANNTWACPVCDKRGGVISLVREHEGMDFTEAVKWLIQTFGIPTEQTAHISLKTPRPVKTTQPTITVPKPMNVTTLNDIVTPVASTDSSFCRSIVANGFLSEDQMQRAAERYLLGRSDDGGVIFWQIDQENGIRDGKIMFYLDDCHRDHDHAPSWVSYRLRKNGRLSQEWTATHCLFGQHLLSAATSSCIVAIVESEKTAVLCSELLPVYDKRPVVWLASGGLSQLQPSTLAMLSSTHPRCMKIEGNLILFPDTDPGGDAFRRWSQVAKDAHKLSGRPIYVSSFLERHASEEQKQRKIDIADLLWQDLF